MGAGHLEWLTPSSTDEALAYLARRPHDNVYVAWLIRAGGDDRGGEVALWRDAADSVAGVCYFGPQIVPCTNDPDALDAFAATAKRVRPPRMVVGPRAAVERFWKTARAWLPPASAIRTSQPVYALGRATVRFERDAADVARATLAELEDIVPNSAQMIAGEIGGDPRNTSAGFRARTARIIERGWWWRYRVNGALAFMCNVGSHGAGTAQLQGVWTPPPLRGHGYATRALGAICARLLDDHASVCLYVNDFNTAAVALYERVGFTRDGEFQTILLA